MSKRYIKTSTTLFKRCLLAILPIMVEYDGRARLNWLIGEVADTTPVSDGLIAQIGTVGKNWLMLFTTNQIKQAVNQLEVGDWTLFAKAL